MNENEEYNLEETAKLYRSKKSRNKRHNNDNNNNKKYVIILLIISFIQFFIILILSFRSKLKSDLNIKLINNTTPLINTDTTLNLIHTTKIEEEKNIIISKIEYKTEEYNTNKNIIHISMAIDNGAVYSSFVSMTSALESNDKNKNILSYHLLLSKDFNMKNMDYFNSLKNNYTFILNYIKIPGIFKSIKKWRSTETVYYKLLIPLLYPDIERMIFLDGDTLIYQDLSEMYNLDFNGTYLLGYPFHTADSLDGLEGEKYKLYINGGVLLFNNFEIRKNNMDLKVLIYTLENHNKNHFLEQDTLNIIYKGKIGLLPLKYGIYLFGNIDQYIKAYYEEKMRIFINRTEMEQAIQNPAIVHLVCCNPKVWTQNTRHEKGFNDVCFKYQKEFYFFANKTIYGQEIYDKYMKQN